MRTGKKKVSADDRSSSPKSTPKSTSIIAKKSDLLNNIIIHIKDYYIRIFEYVQRYKPNLTAEYKNLEAEVDAYNKSLSGFMNNTTNVTLKTLPNLISMFDLWADIRLTLDDMYVLLSDEGIIHYIAIGMSQTYISELKTKLSGIRSLFSLLNTADAEINQSVIENAKVSVLAEVDDDKHPPAAETLLTTILTTHKYPSRGDATNISVVNDVILGILSKFKPKNKNNIATLASYSEELKNISLLAGNRINSHNVSRFNLIPVSDYVKDIYEIIPPGSKNVLYLRRHSDNPMQYNILPLLSHAYVAQNDMITSSASGLNKKILKRFSTIKMLSPDSSSDTASAACTDANELNSTSERVYAVEVMNNTYYRLMYHGIPTKPLAECTISKSEAEKIISGASDRADKYAKISSEAILPVCINKNHKRLMVSFQERQFKPNSSFSLKEYIVSDFMREFTIEFAKKPANPPQNGILSINDIKKIITQTMFKSKQVLRIRMLSYVFNINLPYTADEHPINEGILIGRVDHEMLLTFVVKFEATYKEFTREVLGHLNEIISLGAILKTEEESNPQEQTKAILFACKRILEKAVDAMDAKPSRWINTEITLKNVAVETGLFT